jgi:hypothetical protein
VTIPWAHVSSLNTGSPVTVTTKQGASVQGTVRTEGGSLQVANSDGIKIEPTDEIAAFRNAEEQAVYERYQHPPL